MKRILGVTAALIIGTAGASAGEYWMLHDNDGWTTRITQLDSGLACVLANTVDEGAMSVYGTPSNITGIFTAYHMADWPDKPITVKIQIDQVDPWTAELQHVGRGHFMGSLKGVIEGFFGEMALGDNIRVMDVTIPLTDFPEAFVVFTKCVGNLDSGTSG